MGNITGAPFDPDVKKQIETRQYKLGKVNRDNDDLLFYNSKTAWLRLASSVNVTEDSIQKNIPNLKPASSYTEEKLARKCVLFGGMSSLSDNGNDINLRGGINTDINDILGVGSYGFGGSQERGFNPMPGLVQANISFYNRGAIQKADITLKAYNTTQLQIIDTLYLRIGYTMLLEYGWSVYFDNNKELKAADAITKPFRQFFNKLEKGGKDISNQNYINNLIKEERKERSYNYDAMLGKVVNFHWKFNNDGSYDITINLIGLGDIIEALKINTSSGVGTLIDLSASAKNVLKQTQNLSEKAVELKSQSESSYNDFINYKFNKELLPSNPSITEISKKALFEADNNPIKLLEPLNKLKSKENDGKGKLPVESVPFSPQNFGIIGSKNHIAYITEFSSVWDSNFVKNYVYHKLLLLNTDERKIIEKIGNNTIFDVKNDLKTSVTINEDDFNNGLIKNKKYLLNIILDGIEFLSSVKLVDLFNNNNPSELVLDTRGNDYEPIIKQIVDEGLAPNSFLPTGKYYMSNWVINTVTTTGGDIKSYTDKVRLYFNEIISQGQIAKEADQSQGALESAVESAEKQGGQSVIKYANTTEMNKFIYYNIYLNDTTSNIKSDSKNNKSLTDNDIKKINNICNNNTIKRINFKTKGKLNNSSISYSQHYIKLKALLKFIELKYILYNSEDSSKPIFDFDLDEEYNSANKISQEALLKLPYNQQHPTQCLSYQDQISSDPSICYIDSSYKKEENVGLPLEIWVNINHVSACVQQNIDREGKVTLLSFLQSLITGINNSLGDINKMTFIYDGEVDNKVRLLEESNTKVNHEEDKISKFVVYGLPSDNNRILQGSFITDIDLTVQLPPNMASMATISAQANGSIVGENATGLSNLNVGLKDRVIPERLDKISIEKLMTKVNIITATTNKSEILSLINKIKKSKTKSEEEIYIKKLFNIGNTSDNTLLTEEERDKLKSLIINDPKILLAEHEQAFKTYHDEIYNRNILNQETIDAFTSVNRDLALQYITKDSILNKIDNPFFIPFNLSLTMDGLSGMVNFQRFKITDGILPDSYQYKDTKKDKLNFLIKGISHSIQNNRWTTKIESFAISAKK